MMIIKFYPRIIEYFPNIIKEAEEVAAREDKEVGEYKIKAWDDLEAEIEIVRGRGVSGSCCCRGF